MRTAPLSAADKRRTVPRARAALALKIFVRGAGRTVRSLARTGTSGWNQVNGFTSVPNRSTRGLDFAALVWARRAQLVFRRNAESGIRERRFSVRM